VAKEHAGAGPHDRDDRQLHCLLDTDDENGYALSTLMRSLTLDAGKAPTFGSHEGTSAYSFEKHEAFMSEIQLRGIVNKQDSQISLVSRR
jgi:hypothetical protein